MSITAKSIRIGAGAGYSGDRIEPAVELLEKGALQFLVFECLAERTIALAQQRKAKNPKLGYDPLLEARMRQCLPISHKNKVKIITNMGAANPVAAMGKTAEIARELGLKGLKIAAVTGDDVLEKVKNEPLHTMFSNENVQALHDNILSANAYLGANPLIEALNAGADIIITGRVADPALFLAPLVYSFKWGMNDYELLGKGTLLGHLLECAGQITGGYFADPGYKDVQGLARLGFPLAEVNDKGEFFITKVAGSGGKISPATCKEQLLYEIHDPTQYLTPDVIADFSGVNIRQIGPDKVEVSGGSGKAKSGKLKVSVGYRDSFMGEGQISYGGPGAVERAHLALEIVRERLKLIGIKELESRYDIIGVNSLYGDTLAAGNPAEVRARVAVRTQSMEDAVKIGNEVETLYTNGPAGGGGVSKSAQEIIAIQSVLIDEALVQPKLHFQTS